MKSKFICQSNPKGKDKIIIPRDILNEIASLPNKQCNQKVEFLGWEDELLVKYGKTKSLTKIAKILGKKMTTIRRRYQELLEQQVRGALENI